MSIRLYRKRTPKEIMLKNREIPVGSYTMQELIFPGPAGN